MREIVKVKRGPAYDRSGWIIKSYPTIYATYDAAEAAAAAMPEPKAKTVAVDKPAERKIVSAPVQRDRQADRVARLTGLPTARATSRCHYCGQALRGGYCSECV